jgi:hypothetical protein
VKSIARFVSDSYDKQLLLLLFELLAELQLLMFEGDKVLRRLLLLLLVTKLIFELDFDLTIMSELGVIGEFNLLDELMLLLLLLLQLMVVTRMTPLLELL